MPQRSFLTSPHSAATRIVPKIETKIAIYASRVPRKYSCAHARTVVTANSHVRFDLYAIQIKIGVIMLTIEACELVVENQPRMPIWSSTYVYGLVPVTTRSSTTAEIIANDTAKPTLTQ